jgi:hypothetical protein
MLDILVIALWTLCGAYAAWYFTSAKNYVPMTLSEARLHWKIHRETLQCNGKRLREIRRHGKMVGYECECGYRYFQKRPIVGNGPALDTELQGSEPLAVDRIHTTA